MTILDFILYEYRYHPDQINDTDHHQARVNDARRQMRSRTGKHP